MCASVIKFEKSSFLQGSEKPKVCAALIGRLVIGLIAKTKAVPLDRGLKTSNQVYAIKIQQHHRDGRVSLLKFLSKWPVKFSSIKIRFSF